MKTSASSSCCNPCLIGHQRPSSFQRHLIEQKNDVEATLIQGMKNLTFDQLQREQEDFHGVADSPQEDPDAMGEKIQSLDAHLSRIKAGTIYESAEAKDLAYVSNRDFRMLFLKGNRYDPKAAAEQMIRYFDIKHNLFGDHCLVRDITTQDLTPEDIASILAGTIQISSCTDSSGRLISWAFPGTRANVPLKNVLRGVFFDGTHAVDSIDDTTKGIVMVSYQIGQHRDTKHNDGHYEALQLALALPCNIAAYHFCFSDRAHCILAHAAVSLMPSHLRAKTRIHFGTHLECQYLLSTYGIPREAIPFKHPSNELDLTWQKYWFQQCQEKDQRKLLMQQSGEPCSQKGSEKHIKFLSIRWQGETPVDDDVLCVGRRVNGKGNERYMSMIVSHADAYNRGSPKDRSMVVDFIMEEIKKYGRFLKLDTSESGGWIEVPTKEMRHKVGQTFRNLRYRQGGSQSKARAVLEASCTTTGGATPSTASAIIVDQYTPQDVLFGKMRNHIGNQRLRELVQNVASEYDAANRGEKLRMAQQLMETIKSEGCRFLKPLDGGRWELVSDKDAVKKASIDSKQSIWRLYQHSTLNGGIAITDDRLWLNTKVVAIQYYPNDSLPAKVVFCNTRGIAGKGLDPVLFQCKTAKENYWVVSTDKVVTTFPINVILRKSLYLEYEGLSSAKSIDKTPRFDPPPTHVVNDGLPQALEAAEMGYLAATIVKFNSASLTFNRKGFEGSFTPYWISCNTNALYSDSNILKIWERALDVESKPLDQIKLEIAETLNGMFAGRSVRRQTWSVDDIESIRQTRWSRDELASGSYTAGRITDTFDNHMAIEQFRGNWIPSGEYACDRYAGYVHGGLLAGERVIAILNGDPTH